MTANYNGTKFFFIDITWLGVTKNLILILKVVINYISKNKMLNPLNFISKFIKSSNQKELDRIAKIVERVNSFEGAIKNIAD